MKTTTKKTKRKSDLYAPFGAQDRFKDWTAEDYDKEIKRVQAAHSYLERVIPKLNRAARRDAYKAFDFSI